MKELLGVVGAICLITLCAIGLWKFERRWHWNAAYKPMVEEELAPLSNRVDRVDREYQRVKAFMDALYNLADTSSLLTASIYLTNKDGQLYELRLAPVKR